LEWGKEVLEQIEEVSIDLWKGYKNVVIDLMPNAQVVADRFHVNGTNKQGIRRRKKAREKTGRRFNLKKQALQKKKSSRREFRRMNKSKYVC
jgi:transposase